ADVELLREHIQEANAEGGLLFGAADFDPTALTAAQDSPLALLRVTDGRTAFDTSGWGTPGHYPSWLPAYCAQSVERDPLGQPRYQLLATGQAGVIVEPLRPRTKESEDHGRAAPRRKSGGRGSGLRGRPQSSGPARRSPPARGR